MSTDPKVEKVAEAIYRTFQKETEWINEEPIRAWRIEGVEWDKFPEEELCEHERDDYRAMARSAIKALETGDSDEV